MIPDTIRHPAGFLRSPSAGFDGIFDWKWTQGCFGDTRISPMDIDCVVERHGQFIVFETKGIGLQVPRGQLITLQALHRLGCFTILIVWGKSSPESAQIWYPGRDTKRMVDGAENIRALVSRWYAWADKSGGAA